MAVPLTNNDLNRLRGIGDPELTPYRIWHWGTSKVWDFHGKQSPGAVQQMSWDERYTHAERFIAKPRALAPVERADFDAERMARAHQLFARYGSEISGALLLAALPQAYAAGRGAQVLVGRQRNLATNADRRIRGTAQFLLLVMMADGSAAEARKLWIPGGRAFRACAALRVYHQSIRQAGSPVPGEVAINQEDLLGTLLSFTVVVFEVLERYGISWSAADQDAYWYAWDVVGDQLGIGTAHVAAELGKASRPLRPQTVDDGRVLLEHIRRRQWTSPGDSLDSALSERWRSLRPGRRLMRSLLDELVAAMPRLERRWPAALIRALAPPLVQDRLGLGSGGLPQVLLDNLRPQSHVMAPFTRLDTPNPIGASALRYMNNEVVRHAMLRFLRAREGEQRFELPGLEDWADELAETR